MAEEKVVVATEEKAVENKGPRAPRGDRPQRGPRKDGKKPFKKDGKPFEKQYEERVVSINRISKTVKGGRRMRFAALVVIGDGKGNYGFGTGKAAEVPDAIKKALDAAKKNLYKVPMVKGDTFPHYVEGQFGACKVVMKPAPDGTGIVAGGPVRAVLELAGIKNIYSKVYGSRNSINMVRATVNGITNLKTTAKVNALRGK